jgi:hypothetical protein
MSVAADAGAIARLPGSWASAAARSPATPNDMSRPPYVPPTETTRPRMARRRASKSRRRRVLPRPARAVTCTRRIAPARTCSHAPRSCANACSRPTSASDCSARVPLAVPLPLSAPEARATRSNARVAGSSCSSSRSASCTNASASARVASASLADAHTSSRRRHPPSSYRSWSRRRRARSSAARACPRDSSAVMIDSAACRKTCSRRRRSSAHHSSNPLPPGVANSGTNGPTYRDTTSSWRPSAEAASRRSRSTSTSGRSWRVSPAAAITSRPVFRRRYQSVCRSACLAASVSRSDQSSEIRRERDAERPGAAER